MRYLFILNPAAGKQDCTVQLIPQLQQDILDIRVCLFDLIKQHDAVGASADSLGQLSAFVVAKIPRRCAQQAGHGVLLLIL